MAALGEAVLCRLLCCDRATPAACLSSAFTFNKRSHRQTYSRLATLMKDTSRRVLRCRMLRRTIAACGTLTGPVGEEAQRQQQGHGHQHCGADR